MGETEGQESRAWVCLEGLGERQGEEEVGGGGGRKGRGGGE